MPVPPNPGMFDKVNYVIDAWSCPCEAPWYIYVETLKPALLTAFITLATFGWDDVARGYFRPRGLGRRTSKRGGRGKGGGGRSRGIPEFGDMICKNHATFGGNWFGVRYPDQDYEQLPCFWILQSGATGTADAMVAASVNWETFPGEPPPTGMQIRIINAFTGKVYHESPPGEALDDGTMPDFVSGVVPSGVTFNVQTRHTGTIAGYRKGFVTCMANCKA